jgi:hypothetical protein
MGYLAGNTAQLKNLADQLGKMPEVRSAASRRGNGDVVAEAWQIASALSDIEESCELLFQDLVPRLAVSSAGGEEATALLHEIGEQYRHILYHILDTTLFDYVIPPRLSP